MSARFNDIPGIIYENSKLDRNTYTFIAPNTGATNAGYSNLTLNNNGSQPSGSDVRLIAGSSRPSMESSSQNLPPKEYSKFTKYSTLIILFCVNLLNYMDRFTIISVLSAVRNAFDIDNKKAALLNTVFLISYMILSPVVGYLGKAILSNTDVQVT